MEAPEVIAKIPVIVALSRCPEAELSIGQHAAHFLEHAAYCARQVRPEDRPPWFREWAVGLRRTYDDFEAIRAKDPMCVYQPRNKTALEFHQSPAFVRYFRAGNRTSKTQSGYAEHYFNVTGFHPYRPMPPVPASGLIICGLPFADYSPRVFEKKFLYGEDNNVLSPIFPEGGKWLYRYDKREHTIYIACPECANAGKAATCPSHHKKVTISLVSSEKGVGVVEGFTLRLAHLDEHAPKPFFPAIQMRLADSPGGNVVITATPLHGPEAWEVTEVQSIAEGPPESNRRDPTDPDSEIFASLHHCSMWEGLVALPEQIRAYEVTLDDFQVRARILGIPAAMAEFPVFDREILEEMEERFVQEPRRGRLACGVDLVDADDETEITFNETAEGQLRVWEQPQAGQQYIVAVDTAAGLHRGDPSCASVLKVGWKNNAMIFSMVAQWHGWIPVHEYADEVFKLALWYNSGLVVVELTGGLGRAVVERLKKELFYWNIFREIAKGEAADFFLGARLGVDTSAYSKAPMVGILQQVISSKRIKIPCKDTIAELVAFEQTRTDLGNPRYGGAGGSHDDRVMSLVIGVSTAISHSLVDTEQVVQQGVENQPRSERATGDDAKIWDEVHKELNTSGDADQWL